MNPPLVYMYSPFWTLLPPLSPYHPSGSSQCTSPKHPVSCIEPGLAIRFIYDIIQVSMPLSQIIPPLPLPQSPKDCSIHLCLFCCLAYKVLHCLAYNVSHTLSCIHCLAYNVLHCWWECKLVQPLWRTVWRFLKKLEIGLPYDPAIPLRKPELKETRVPQCSSQHCL